MPEESNLTEKLQEKQSEIKFTSIARIRLEEQEISLAKEHDTLVETFNKIQNDEQKFLDGITKKYGQGSLNPETGVFTPNKSQ